jgi:hypothetical protein
MEVGEATAEVASKVTRVAEARRCELVIGDPPPWYG